MTPHKLRHTFASILSALGREPVFAMRQLGHSDPRFTLRVYTHVMSRGDDERERLRALVEGDLTSLHDDLAAALPPAAQVEQAGASGR